jgi:hypothetical protein
MQESKIRVDAQPIYESCCLAAAETTVRQISQSIGIKQFIGVKFGNTAFSDWGWHGYMSNTYTSMYPLRLSLTTNMMRCLMVSIQFRMQRRVKFRE